MYKNIANLELSPSHASTGSFQIALPIIVLPKDDRTDFAQEERLGLRYWTLTSAICVVVDESTCLDIPTVEFKIICEHPSIFTWVLADTASAACPCETWLVWR